MYIAKHTLAVIALIIAVCLWGAAGPVLKWSMSDASPFTLVFFRFTFATLIILPFVIKKIKIRAKDIYKICLLSFFTITLHMIFYYLGLNLAPSINLPIITSTMPIFLIIGGMLFLNERPKANALIGTLISLAGAAIIIIQPLITTDQSGTFLGNIFFLISTLTFVIYTLLLKKFDLDYPFSTLLFWMFFIGALSLFPFYLTDLITHTTPQIIDLKTIIGTVYGAVIASVICYLLYSYGAKHTSADETGIFMYIEPFVTALVAIPLLGETITFTYLLGSIFVFSGIIVAEARLHHPIQLFKRKTYTQIESGP